MSSSSSLRLWLILLASFSLSVSLLTQVKNAPGIDYLQFWILGNEMPLESYEQFRGEEAYKAAVARVMDKHGGDSDIQRAVDWREDLQLTATPLHYALFGITVGDDYLLDLRLFQLVSFALFFGGMAYLFRLWGYSWPGIAVALATLTVFCTPLHSDIRVTNTNQLYIGLVAGLFWLTRRKSFFVRTAVAQAAAGLALLFKPYLLAYFAILIPLRIARRRWKSLAYESAGASIGIAIGFLVPLLMGAPLELWREFVNIHLVYIEHGVYRALEAKGDMSGVELVTDAIDVSYFQFGVALLVLYAIVSVAILSLTRNRQGQPRSEFEDSDLAIALSLSLFLLVCPLVWAHYYLLSLPLVFLLLQRPVPRGWFGRVWPVALITALVLLVGAWLSEFYALLGGTEKAAFMARQFQIANLILAIVGLAELVRRVRGRLAAAEPPPALDAMQTS